MSKIKRTAAGAPPTTESYRPYLPQVRPPVADDSPLRVLFNEKAMRSKARKLTDKSLRPKLGAYSKQGGGADADRRHISTLTTNLRTKTQCFMDAVYVYGSDKRVGNKVSEYVVDLAMLRYELGYFELNQAIKRKNKDGTPVRADAQADTPEKRTGRGSASKATEHIKNLKLESREVTEANAERQKLKNDLADVQKQLRRRKLPPGTVADLEEEKKKLQDKIREMPRKSVRIMRDPRLRFTYPLHERKEYRLGGGVVHSDHALEEGVSQELADIWRAYIESKQPPLNQHPLDVAFGLLVQAKGYRDAAKGLGIILIHVDFLMSLYVYLEERVGAKEGPEWTPYSDMHTDLNKLDVIAANYEPANYDTRASSSSKKEERNRRGAFEYEDLVGPQRK